MSTYVMGDIHGEYDKFRAMLEKIGLGEEDTLYVIGDILDRGPEPIRTLQYIMGMANAVVLAGNHELMAMECLKFLNREIKEDTVKELEENMIRKLVDWQINGSESTQEKYAWLSCDEKAVIMDFLENELLAYEDIEIGENRYIIVHAGLGDYDVDTEPDQCSLADLVWTRADYSRAYFSDEHTYLVTGHTPTQNIEENDRPGYIYRKNGHIAIDCGSCFPGGRLAAICLETGEEFYVE